MMNLSVILNRGPTETRTHKTFKSFYQHYEVSILIAPSQDLADQVAFDIRDLSTVDKIWQKLPLDKEESVLGNFLKGKRHKK